MHESGCMEKTRMTVVELAELAKEGPVVLIRAGHPVVAVKDLSGSDWESVSLASNPKFMALIEESRRSYPDSGRDQPGRPSPRTGPGDSHTLTQLARLQEVDLSQGPVRGSSRVKELSRRA